MKSNFFCNKLIYLRILSKIKKVSEIANFKNNTTVNPDIYCG